MTTYFLLGDDGLPTGAVDHDWLEDAAVLFGWRMAAHSHDPDALNRISGETREAVGAEMFGPVAAAALRMLVENLIEPLLKVTDECQRAGFLGHDFRAGLHTNLEDVEESLGGDQ